MELISLHTARLLIRDHVLADLETHHNLLSSTKAMYYLQDIRTTTLENSKRNLEESITQIDCADRVCYFLRIEEAVTHKHVGEIGYTVTDFTPIGKLVHLGYFLCPEAWGKGYATEAAMEVIRFGFMENGVYRISTGCIRDNAASERVMQKCGMQKEADMIKKQWHDGRMKDRVSYRLLKDEWLAAQAAGE